MTNKQIIRELEQIKNTGRGCLCGHFESCENCSPSSATNQIRGKIDKLIDRINKS